MSTVEDHSIDVPGDENQQYTLTDKLETLEPELRLDVLRLGRDRWV